jgi:UPF0755 protein
MPFSSSMDSTQRISKWLFYLVLFPATLGFCVWQSWGWWSWANAPVAATKQPSGLSTVQIKVPDGTSAQQIGQDLESAGLIRSATAWSLWVRWQTLRDRNGSFLAGTYALSATEPMTAIASKIWQGQVVQQSFTIPEGWSTQQMAKYFEANGFFSADAFLQAARQVPNDRYPWLPAQLPQLEGFLYPDTYQVPAHVTPEAVVDLMLNRFEQVALPLYQPGRSPYSLQQWVTLASIVEKEAVVEQERPEIASVFAKRLQENIPLGADPTVEYAFGIRQTPAQPLTLAQVNTPSAYNTYLNRGLPPTAIASPGLASLESTLNPKDTPYLYFVARYDGTHVFSRTLAEHEAAQTKIRDDLAAQPQTKAGSAN